MSEHPYRIIIYRNCTEFLPLQSLADVPPVVMVCVSTGHGLHADRPGVSLYVSNGQGRQVSLAVSM